MNDHECGECLRWPECAGVSWGTPECPETKKEKQPDPAWQFFDDKTESGLLEED